MTASLSPASVQHGRAPSALSAEMLGTGAGILAALIWATYMVAAKAGTASGLQPLDFALLRFAPAAAIMLPWLWRHQPQRLAGIGWRRGLLLTLLAGPPFILLSTGGYAFAPLAHGAVIQPSTIALASMATAAVLLREPATAARLAGILLIIAGLALIAGHGGGGPSQAWIGDLLFVAAGLSWTLFTILIRRWALAPLAVTAAVASLSALITLPFAVADGSLGRIAALPPEAIASQLLVQGLLSGVVAVIAFATAVRHLGAARAGLFPAMVPAVTLLIGGLLGWAMPAPFEIAGAGLASFGLALSVGLFTPHASNAPSKG
jgi:drug/metabolite transporter (DMT)-like permease